MNTLPIGDPPDTDCIFTWKGDGKLGNWESSCRLRIFRPHPEQTVVIVSDLGKDTGTSITNSLPTLAKLVIEQYAISFPTLVWIEQYPHYRGTPEAKAEFAKVILTWNEGNLCHCWQPIDRAEVERLVLFPL